jgi:hypothetical protein
MFGIAFPYWWLLDSGLPLLVGLAMVLSLVVHDMQYGPQAALVAESFTGRLRFSGASLGYHLAAITAGGPAPLIATYLLATYHSSAPIAFLIMVAAAIGFVAAAFLRDRGTQDLSIEYDEPAITSGGLR